MVVVVEQRQVLTVGVFPDAGTFCKEGVDNKAIKTKRIPVISAYVPRNSASENLQQRGLTSPNEGAHL